MQRSGNSTQIAHTFVHISHTPGGPCLPISLRANISETLPVVLINEQRSGAPVPAEVLPAASHPDPEVVARPQRRSYTAEYKVRILREAEAAAAIRGSIGALLRHEGLYSSLL